MADSARARRLAKRIVTIVATELQHQVKDPRLAMVTVTAATVTPDLREANDPEKRLDLLRDEAGCGADAVGGAEPVERRVGPRSG